MGMWSWYLVRLVYFFATVFAYEAISCLAPVWFTCHHVLATCIFGAVASKFFFEMTKENLFKKEVSPRNKAVFISGCDSGFGKLAAIQLDSKGFHVFAGCLFPTKEGATELKNICSERLLVVHVDVTNDEIVEKAKDFIQQNLGTCELWAVVNNAGLLKGFSIEFTQVADFQEVFDVNALGQVRVTRALLPLLKRSKGRVINVNSIAGRIPTAHIAAYGMSKHASVAFTECLRQEMSDWGVQVISVEPEFFKTPITNSDGIRLYLQAILGSLDTDTKTSYGSEYMSRVQVMMQNTFSSLTSSRIDRVTEAIEKAVARKRPCLVYKPCGNMVRKIWFHLAENLDFFIDVFRWGYFAYWGVRKPRGAGGKRM